MLHFQLYTILLNYFRYLRSFVVCTDFRGRTQRRRARSCGHIRSPAAIPQHFKVLYIFCTLYTKQNFSRMRSAHSRHLISAIRNGFNGIGTNYLRSDTESIRLLRGSRMLVRGNVMYVCMYVCVSAHMHVFAIRKWYTRLGLQIFYLFSNDQFSMICILHSLIVPIVFISELSTSVKTLHDLKNQT